MADALTKPDPFLWRTRPRAPQPGTVLAPLSELEDGSAREFIFGRGTTVFSMFVVRRGDKAFGYLNLCPHYSSPLNYRTGHFLNEDGSRIRCTMHFAEFRIEDGFGVAGAAQNCWLDPVPVHIKDGNIVISGPGDLS
ncbi:MAG: Rieske (2Fe-2S) protein [Devosia sp.]|nr:Rieske (2Fe-2S) protein [Devosia sp.]